MLETIMNSDVFFWTMGVIAGVSVLCKVITAFTLKRLVRAAGKMGKSNQKLMKLVKAKFEHAFMLSDRVDNVSAFVEKYLFEYKIWGIRLHTYRYFEKQSVWLMGILGLAGMLLSYTQPGMEEETFRYGAIGGAVMVLLFLVRNSSDEEHQLEVVKTYMIDYLENVCAPRYSKQQALKTKRMENVMNENIVEAGEETFAENKTILEDEISEDVIKAVENGEEYNRNPEMKELKLPEMEKDEEEVVKEEKVPEPEIQNIEINREKSKDFSQKEEEEEKIERRIPQEVILREILEEFLA